MIGHKSKLSAGRSISFNILFVLWFTATGFFLSSYKASGQDAGSTDSLKLDLINPEKVDKKILAGIPVDTIQFNLNTDLRSQLKPLDSIIAYCMANSPTLKFEASQVKKFHYNHKYNRYVWLDGVTGFYNYSYGDQSFLITGSTLAAQASNNLANGYRYGYNIQFPLSLFFTQAPKMKSLKAEVEGAKMKKEEAAIELKRRIIQDYFVMLAAQKMVSIRIEDEESSRLAYEIGSVEMKRGKIHPSELARLRNILAMAESGLEMAKRDFMISYYQFEALLGVKLTFFKK